MLEFDDEEQAETIIRKSAEDWELQPLQSNMSICPSIQCIQPAGVSFLAKYREHSNMNLNHTCWRFTPLLKGRQLCYKHIVLFMPY